MEIRGSEVESLVKSVMKRRVMPVAVVSTASIVSMSLVSTAVMVDGRGDAGEFGGFREHEPRR